MSLVDSETGEIVEVLDAARARDLTDRIKVAVEATWQLIAEAYTARAWAALGYSSWDDYCTREFGNARLRLPREDRQEAVASLRESGLSVRAIAAATGVSKNTVKTDLRQVGHFDPPDAHPSDPEFAELAQQLDDRLSRPPADPDVEPRFKSSVKPMKPPAPKVTGMDGKSYAARAVADDAPVRARTLEAITRWETCPRCAGKGQIRKEASDADAT